MGTQSKEKLANEMSHLRDQPQSAQAWTNNRVILGRPGCAGEPFQCFDKAQEIDRSVAYRRGKSWAGLTASRHAWLRQGLAAVESCDLLSVSPLHVVGASSAWPKHAGQVVP